MAKTDLRKRRITGAIFINTIYKVEVDKNRFFGKKLKRTLYVSG